MHYGNNLEFFVDLLAVWWRLDGCAVPIDARLTAYEIESTSAVSYICEAASATRSTRVE